jgi:hypothetical protein
MFEKIGSNLSERKRKKIKLGYKNKKIISYGQANNLKISQKTCKKNIYVNLVYNGYQGGM